MWLDATDPLDHWSVIFAEPCKSGAVVAQVSLPWRRSERTQASNTFPWTVRDMCLEELLELSLGSTTPGYNGKRATATSAQHVTKITDAGFNIKQSSIYIFVCDCVAINWMSLSTTPWANIVWNCNKSALETTALFNLSIFRFCTLIQGFITTHKKPEKRVMKLKPFKSKLHLVIAIANQYCYINKNNFQMCVSSSKLHNVTWINGQCHCRST